MAQSSMFTLDTEDIAYLFFLSGITSFPGILPEASRHFSESAQKKLEAIMMVRGMMSRGEEGQIQLEETIANFLQTLGEARFIATLTAIHPEHRAVWGMTTIRAVQGHLSITMRKSPNVDSGRLLWSRRNTILWQKSP